MAWMFWVVATFSVIKALQHQLRSGGWWQKLSLKQVRHGLEELAHFKFFG